MLNADLAIGFDIVIAVSCFALTARDKAGPAFFTANECSPACRIRRGVRQRGDLGCNRTPLRVSRVYQAWRCHDGQ